MPVGPSYYPSSRSYYRTSPSVTSLLNRTTSLDRPGYTSTYTPSSYGLGSSYSSSSSYGASKYSSTSRPPRPSYSSSYSSSDSTYRSRNSRDISPLRSSYTGRNSSERHDSVERSIKGLSLTGRSISDSSSRYAASTIASRLRDSSTSRDSGYSSRIASRDRSLDVKNANTFDTNAYGPSASSYASNYRWERRNKNKETKTVKETDEQISLEKPRVSERIRSFETIDDESPSVAAPRASLSEEAVARRKRDEDSIAARRQRLGLSPIRNSRSRTPDCHSKRQSPSYESEHLKSSPERNGNEDDDEEIEQQKSVSELRRKYDTANYNGYASSSKEEEESNDLYSPSTSYRETPTIRCESPSDTTTSRRRTDSGSSCSRDAASSSSKYSGSHSLAARADAGIENDTSNQDNRSRRTVDSAPSRSPDGRKSPLTNGTASKPSLHHQDDPSCSSSSRFSSSSPSAYLAYRAGGNRSDRVRERVAARLAREVDEDEDSPCGLQLSSEGDFSEKSGLVGLRNIGNTCFLNSVTQCLSNTRCLLEYLVQEGYSGDYNTSLSTMKGDLIRAFGSLVSEMWSEGRDSSRALNTGPFKTQIQRFAPTFTGYQQHDAQEFLRKLLEGLHEDVNRVSVRPRPILSDIDDDLSDDQKAMESWKRYLRFDDSKIVDMFVGQLKSSLQCSHCSHTSVTFDPFWDLSLPIPNKSGGVRLNQCLDLFTKEEVMDGDERPTCSKCKERRKMTKSFSIKKFPKVLVLHLKRFSPTERWRGKLSCTVEFPLENLDLSKYASSTRSSNTYNLIGVANHSGTTYSGHYTAFCRHPYSGQWHEYNDSRVSSIPGRRVCSPEAYVLFYELAGTYKL